ncbi:MAG: tyrosine-type recombinase/integrase [Hungatella sp.]|jgi:site-specific recombinase XerD|nr:tyrosine-type recombinase/integrase [Hungatella sp.]
MKTSLLYEESCDTIQGFVTSQVLKRGLDERTEKAYRLDLEHLHAWIRNRDQGHVDETAVEEYLDYLMKEKKLKYSTVTRKYRVFRYYLEYLDGQGHLPGYRPISCPKAVNREDDKGDNELSRAEVDSFFMALNREYENLDNEFRRRVCLRDSVMMELLFYHGIEISELLRLEVSDYNIKSGVLTIRGKRDKERAEYLFSRELRRKMEQWIGEHGYFEKNNEFHNVLFLSKIGKPLSMKMVILVFDKYRVMAGIEKESTPKDLKCSMKRYAREMVVERCS